MAPTLRSICAFASLLSVTLAAATPTPTGQKQPVLPLYELGASNTGSTALPTPTAQPKYIALGIGFQNYTCGTVGSSPNHTFVQSQPGDGAVANLYDITKYVDSCNVDFTSAEALAAFETCLYKTKCNRDANDNCAICQLAAITYMRSRGLAPAPQIGQHYFTTINGSQTPNFRVKSDFLSGKKVGDVKAPANASQGSVGYGPAVDWLYLPSNKYNLTHGLSSVYRVETAGGAPPQNCSYNGQVTSQPYAAEYWFYA